MRPRNRGSAAGFFLRRPAFLPGAALFLVMGALAMGAQEMEKDDAQWRKELTPEEYRILRQKGTEPAFSGQYWKHKEKGTYLCAGCGAELFDSDAKFESGTGWPSFWEPVSPGQVAAEEDLSHGMRRTEVHCSRCGGHLGHLFNDGPEPTGLRYCINSGALKFQKSD